MSQIRSVSIVGCGWLGTFIAEQLLDNHYRVVGSVRRDLSRDFLEKKHIHSVIYDTINAPPPSLLESDALIFLVPFRRKGMDAEHYEEGCYRFLESITSTHYRRIILASSIGVYRSNRQWKLEDDDMDFMEGRAGVMRRVETAFLSKFHKKTIVFRLGGLVGLDRQVKPVSVDTRQDGPINTIHVSQITTAVLCVLNHQKFQGIYNLVQPYHPCRSLLQAQQRLCMSYDQYKIVSARKFMMESGVLFV